MKHLVEFITTVTFLAAWVFGQVLAKGFWSTLFAVCFPPWAWYLLAERLWQHLGCI